MKHLAFIGCYTAEQREGIHTLEVDCDTGSLRLLHSIPESENATYLTLAKTRQMLYTCQNLKRQDQAKPGSGGVAAYTLKDNTLQLVDQRPAIEGRPCYVALDPTEQALVFAEYSSGIAGVFELAPDGTFADTPPVSIKHQGSSINPKRQTKAHAHCAVISPDGKYLCVPDLGIDKVMVYNFPNRSQGLQACESLCITSTNGAGPRHIIFHPEWRTAWLLHELDNTISSFIYTGEAFVHVQTISMLPDGFQGESKASAIKLSPDGQQLLGSNRGYDSIASYHIDPETGKMELAAISPLSGKFPRDFEFMPSGKFVLVGHEHSNNLATYAYAPGSGKLTPVNAPLPLHRPVCIVFGDQIKG